MVNSHVKEIVEGKGLAFEFVNYEPNKKNKDIFFHSYKEFGIVNVGTTPLFLYYSFTESKYVLSSRRDILFVGGFGHQPNCDAMAVFLGQSFPTIVKKTTT